MSGSTAGPLKRKFVVRLLPQVDSGLRQMTRRQGDLSRFVEEAILAAPDLLMIPLAPSSTAEKPRATTVALSKKVLERVERAAKKRGAASNVLINAVVWHWLKKT